jgi:hypothetical protein
MNVPFNNSNMHTLKYPRAKKTAPVITALRAYARIVVANTASLFSTPTLATTVSALFEKRRQDRKKRIWSTRG